MRNMLKSRLFIAVALIPCIAASPALAAQEQVENTGDASSAETDVREANAQFWDAFNACDINSMAAFLTEDVEFYHDREGMNRTREAVSASMVSGPCAPDSEMRLRREAVAADETFAPLEGGYALLTGTQRFLSRQNNGQDNGPERHDTAARFSSLWQETPQGWQMRHVISYDHRPDEPKLVRVTMSADRLRALAGEYQMQDGTPLLVTMDEGELTIEAGPGQFALVPIGNDLFGTQGRWLRFQFAEGAVTIFDEGIAVAEAQRASE